MLKSLRDKTRLARGLSLSDWLSLLEAWWKLLGYYLALRWVSYERLNVPNYKPSEGSPKHDLQVALDQHLLVARASRLHLLPMTCLPRALTLRSMLGRRGIVTELHIGAKKTVNGIHAHAWVDIQGQAIGESDEVSGSFQVLDN